MPEGFVSPMLWGVEERVKERFMAAGVPEENITFLKDSFTFNSAGTPAQLLDIFRLYYGPTMNAYDGAEKTGSTNVLHRDLGDLFNTQNKGTAGNTSITANSLRVSITK